MVKNNHQYSRSIREKCTELEYLNEDLNKKLDERKHILDKSIEVHESLHQVGVYYVIMLLLLIPFVLFRRYQNKVALVARFVHMSTRVNHLSESPQSHFLSI